MYADYLKIGIKPFLKMGNPKIMIRKPYMEYKLVKNLFKYFLYIAQWQNNMLGGSCKNVNLTNEKRNDLGIFRTQI